MYKFDNRINLYREQNGKKIICINSRCCLTFILYLYVLRNYKTIILYFSSDICVSPQ